MPIWAVMILVYSVLSAQWALADVVGHQIGLPPERIGPLLALVSLLGTIGALAASHRRSHELRLPILWAAQLLMAGAALWFFVVHGWADFFAAQLLVSFAYYAVTPFLTSRISEPRRRRLAAVAQHRHHLRGGVHRHRAGGHDADAAGRLGCGLALGACAVLAMPFTWKAFGRAATMASRRASSSPRQRTAQPCA
jgi:hypothetical protein